MQIAPETAHSRPPGSAIVMASSEPGSTVISHRSWRPSTRRAPVTSPSLTVNASSRSDWSPIAMSSLNATRKRNARSPSCASGSPSNAAVSGAGPSGPESGIATPRNDRAFDTPLSSRPRTAITR